MSKDFIPRTDDGLKAFAAPFSAKVTATPVAFGVTAAIATVLATKYSAFSDALALAQDPLTRGGSVIQSKDTKRDDLVSYIRQVARQIQGTMTVTDQQRYDLGLTVKAPPAPVPPPSMSPGILVDDVVGRIVKLRFIDPQNPSHRGRPAGVHSTSVFSFVGAEAPADPSAFKFEGTVNGMETQVEFPTSVAPGAKVWFTAFFSNPRSESGLACAPVSTNLQFGGNMPVAA